ncbi:MAG TPA: hypothetical protein VGG89_02565 [Candidatus Baltobacteraceae bacterium]|jgi:hypothetical protein
MREPDFELSADMRLLELQRGALGLPPRERTSWESRHTTEGIPVAQSEPEPGRTPVLAVEAAAFPPDGVIAGAVVTMSLSVANEGAAEADDVVVLAPLPGGAAYRPGTFVWNGRSTYDEVADSFFNQGLPIGALVAGARATFQWKIGVRLGTKPLVISPHVRSGNAAVVGGRSVVIGRKDQVATAFAGEVVQADATIYDSKPLIPVDIPATDLPIYELDEEEQLVYEAADAALSTAAPVVPAPQLETGIVEPEPQPEPEPPVPVREAVAVYGTFDRATLAFFERIFAGSKPPTILQHCIFGGALACTLDGRSADSYGLKRHLDAQAAILHRIGLHEKLGKKEPISEYAGELLASIDDMRPQPIAKTPSAGKDRIALVVEISEPTRQLLAKISEERARWDFVKARQLTLALQAQNVGGIDDERLASDIETALRAYAQASVTVLQKLFVRIRIDRTTGLLFANEPAFDAAATSVIGHLKRALA